MRIGYLGPPGTFSHEALEAAAGPGDEGVALSTIYDVVMAVHERAVDRALVPIENSLEGSVNATLDTLAVETDDVAIIGELVHPIRNCLIARDERDLDSITTVVSHPQPSAQCARFIRKRLPHAQVVPVSSTAEAVRIVAEREDGWAAIGTRAAAALHGCEVLRADIDDLAGNETRFVWLAPAGTDAGEHGPWKTSVVFWGIGDDAPGWLVRCLSEFAFRGVNLTLIESRPRRQGLGHYMFFADLEGHGRDDEVAGALEAVRKQVETLKVLGSYPSA